MEADSKLAHYGIKGMHWGVRRAKLQTAVRGAPRNAAKLAVNTYKPADDAIKAQKYMTRAKLGGVQNLNNHEMRLVINRMQLEKQYKELYGERQFHHAGKKFAHDVLHNILVDAGSSWLKRPGSNFSGRTSATAYRWGKQVGSVLDSPTKRKTLEAA